MAVQGAIPKQPAETFPIWIDFKNRLPVPEAISGTPTVTSRNLATQVDSTGVVLTGTPVVTGSVVTVRCQAGTSGDNHRVQFRIVTTLSNTYEEELDLKIKEH